MMSSGSEFQFALPRWGEWGSNGELGVEGLGEGRKRGAFDMRREGTWDSEGKERLEARAGGS